MNRLTCMIVLLLNAGVIHGATTMGYVIPDAVADGMGQQLTSQDLAIIKKHLADPDVKNGNFAPNAGTDVFPDEASFLETKKERILRRALIEQMPASGYTARIIKCGGAVATCRSSHYN